MIPSDHHSFPQKKKRLGGLLSEEGKHLCKKMATGFMVGSALLGSSAPLVRAETTHANFSGTCKTETSTDTSYNYGISYDGGSAQCNVNHASGLINGHFSGTPGHTLNTSLGGVSHVSGHSSHCSHGSHCSCNGDSAGGW